MVQQYLIHGLTAVVVLDLKRKELDSGVGFERTEVTFLWPIKAEDVSWRDVSHVANANIYYICNMNLLLMKVWTQRIFHYPPLVEL